MARVGRAEYVRKAMHDVKRTFFGGSLRSMLSYFIREEEISEEELVDFLHEMEAPSNSPFGGVNERSTLNSDTDSKQ